MSDFGSEDGRELQREIIGISITLDEDVRESLHEARERIRENRKLLNRRRRDIDRLTEEIQHLKEDNEELRDKNQRLAECNSQLRMDLFDLETRTDQMEKDLAFVMDKLTNAAAPPSTFTENTDTQENTSLPPDADKRDEQSPLLVYGMMILLFGTAVRIFRGR